MCALLRVGWLLSLALMMVLTGCSTPRYEIPGNEIEMVLSASPAPGRVTLSVATNLPEASRLHVALLRPYRHEGDAGVRYGSTALAVLEVRDGTAGPATLIVDDEIWYEDVAARVRGGADPPLAAVEDRLRILLLFSPRVEQEPHIYALLGDDFAHLQGAPQLAPAAGDEVHFWYLQEEASVLQGFPLERRIEPAS